MTAFVQVAEVWVPRSGELRLHSGAYGVHGEFAAVSKESRFALGDGLPGSVWSSRKPQVWDSLEENEFVRFAEAERAGLVAGLGIPVAPGGREAEAVVVLLCGGAGTGGCIERWDVAGDMRELRYAGGYYANLEPLAKATPRMRFQAGMGLPGITLQRGLPTIEEDTRSSASFSRAELARECGVEAGLGIPIYRGGKVAHVLVLLSTESTPLARAFEVWVPSHGNSLKLESGFYGKGLESFAEVSRLTRFQAGRGLPGKAYQTELPQIFSSLKTPRFVRSEAAQSAGLKVGVAIPIHNGRDVVAVVVLLS